MNQAIYRKYRPKGWGEVIGQDHVVQTIRNAILRDRVGHAYLFAGPRGTGKTTLARILAKSVNCLAADAQLRPCNECQHCAAANEGRFLDMIEMDAASNTGVDDVRDLRDRIGFAPSQGRFKVYIIDEVHMLSPSAFNALLKTLEEPPPHAMFVLATTEIQKIPATVLSRCQRHEFRRVPVQELAANLRTIAEAEGWQADEEALALIARQATGSVRDAQSLLDQLASAGTRITIELAQAVLGTATSSAVLEILDAVQADAPAAALASLRRSLDAGVDPRTLARQIIDYLRSLLFIQMGNADRLEVTQEIKERMVRQAAALGRRRVLSLLRTFGVASESRGTWHPSLGLEMALAEALSVTGQASTASDGPATGPEGRLEGKRALVSSPRAQPQASARERPGPSYQGGEAPQPERSDTNSILASSSSFERPSDSGQTGTIVEPGAIDLAKVIAAWRDIRGTLKRSHPAVDGLLNSCKPVEAAADELVLGFQSEAVRALMDRPENLEAARRAIAAVLGRPVRLRCVVINARGKVPPNVSQDGMVATALNHGGEIVDQQE